jgi:hypothetical protein
VTLDGDSIFSRREDLSAQIKSVTFINHPGQIQSLNGSIERQNEFSSEPAQNFKYFPYEAHDVTLSTVFNNLEKQVQSQTHNEGSLTPLRRVNSIRKDDEAPKGTERGLSAGFKKKEPIKYCVREGKLVPEQSSEATKQPTDSKNVQVSRSGAITPLVDFNNSPQRPRQFTESGTLVYTKPLAFENGKTTSTMNYKSQLPISTSNGQILNSNFVNYDDLAYPVRHQTSKNVQNEQSKTTTPTFNPYSEENQTSQHPYRRIDTQKAESIEGTRTRIGSISLSTRETPQLLGYIKKIS